MVDFLVPQWACPKCEIVALLPGALPREPLNCQRKLSFLHIKPFLPLLCLFLHPSMILVKVQGWTHPLLCQKNFFWPATLVISLDLDIFRQGRLEYIYMLVQKLLSKAQKCC